MVRHWTITTRVTGRKREVELHVYEGIGDLRRAASRFSRVVGEEPGSFNDALGVCHGFHRLYVHANGGETESPLVAKIRLWQGNLTPLVVAHEIAHAAQHIYGIDYNDDQPIAEHMHSGNEDFAHLYGELFAAVDRCLTTLKQE